ncbi:MAG: AtpZ/AtpI family protein [Myxococcales bacterium]|nr:AtpZ/AtpI family protein [Myxococcales bacterium]
MAKQLKKFGAILTLGIEMGVCIAIGFFGGRYLAEEFDTGPWLQWVGLVFGIAAAFKSLYTVARKMRDELSRDSNHPEPPQ